MQPQHHRSPSARCSVVIATRDRRGSLLATLERLTSLPERPPVIVVDNGSTDGSPEAVGTAFPTVELVTLRRNHGAPARNVGVTRALTPYVAFADDDSWWAPGSLARAAELLDRHPRLAVIAGRVLVGREEREDPTSAAMAGSPLGSPPDLEAPSVLGFLACGAVVRRSAFLEVGGFDDLIFFVGEEERVALDLAAAGWHLVYDAGVVAHHHPSTVGNRTGRRRQQLRNEVLTTWLRRPFGVAATRTIRLGAAALRGEEAARGALAEVVVRLPRAWRQRRPVPAHLEAAVRSLS